MAVNPLARTGDQNTLKMSDLLRIPVRDRVTAAKTDSSFIQMILNSLTPIEVAKAFPSYYRDAIPDVSNFVTKNIEAKLAAGGMSWHQTEGGNQGTARPGYTGETGPDDDARPTSPKPSEKAAETALDRVKKRLKDVGIEYDEFQKTGTTVTSGIKNESGKIISTALTDISPNKRAFLDTLAIGNKTEGKGYWESPGYNAKVFGGTFDSYADHPRQRRIKGSNAAGRYQFLESTWDETVVAYNKKYPDDPITDFSPINQDKAALFLAETRYSKYTRGRNLWKDLEKLDPGEVIKILGPTWEILTLKNSNEIGGAYNKNLGRNEEYFEKEKEAAGIEKVEPDLSSIDPKIVEAVQQDPEVKEFFDNNPELWTQVPKAIEEGKLTVDDLTNDITKVVEQTGSEAKVDKKLLESAPGEIPMATENPDAIGADRQIPLTEHENGIRILNRLNWMAEQVSAKTGEKITYEIFSPLQPPGSKAEREAKGLPGTGGHRHGYNVGAADVRWVAESPGGKKRYITANSTGEDAELLGQILYHAGYAGFTGIGIGKSYQGGHTHLGFGSFSLWNSGAKGDLMKNEYSQYIYSGIKDAKNADFTFDEYHKARLEEGKKIAEREEGSTVSAADETAKVGIEVSSSSQKTMVISMGTNDWDNSTNTYENTRKTIEAAQAKGYKVVVIPPRTGTAGGKNFDAVSAEVKRAANDTNADIELVADEDWTGYGNYHLSDEKASEIAKKFGPSTSYLGDSIAFDLANRSGGLGTTSSWARNGASTEKILGFVDDVDDVSASVDVEQSEVPSSLTVGENETLYTIARKSGISVDKLAEYNNIEAPYPVEVGQSIKLPPATIEAKEEAVQDKTEKSTEELEAEYRAKRAASEQEIREGLAGKEYTEEELRKLRISNYRAMVKRGEELRAKGVDRTRDKEYLKFIDTDSVYGDMLTDKYVEKYANLSDKELQARIDSAKEGENIVPYSKVLKRREEAREATASETEQTQATVEEEPTEMAQGGFIPEKDNLSVVNGEGKTLAKINQGELNGGIRADGTGLRVVSNKTRIADDIVERNTMPSVTEQTEPQTQEKPVEQKNQVMKDDQQWRESSMIDTSYSAGTQVRAFRRSKFMPEGYHFNRATPGSLA